MNIYLVRHGQSESNVDRSIGTKVADHAISLSERGHAQAREAGYALLRAFRGDAGPYELLPWTASGKIDCRVWVSPYKRTRQTSQGILDVFNEAGAVPAYGVREHINLVEQQFGLFDGLEDDELARLFPLEHAHYKKCEDFEGRFWARMPMGESRFDVAVRVHEMFGTFHRDGVKNLIIVAHGVTLRAITMQWLHLPYEWFEEEPNPKNCSIRLIEGNTDRGYIFEGF